MALDLAKLQELAKGTANRTVASEPVQGFIQYGDDYKVPVMVITLDSGEEGGVTLDKYQSLLKEIIDNGGIMPDGYRVTGNGYWAINSGSRPKGTLKAS